MKRFKDSISLSEATKFCDLSQDNLNWLARHGKLKATKVGRNWVTTREWLDDYCRRRAAKSNWLKLRAVFRISEAPIIARRFWQIIVSLGKIKIAPRGARTAAAICGCAVIFFAAIGLADHVGAMKFSALKNYFSATRILVGAESFKKSFAHGGIGMMNNLKRQTLNSVTDSGRAVAGITNGANDFIGRAARDLGKTFDFAGRNFAAGLRQSRFAIARTGENLAEGARAVAGDVVPEIWRNIPKLSISPPDISGAVKYLSQTNVRVESYMSDNFLAAANVARDGFDNPSVFCDNLISGINGSFHLAGARAAGFGKNSAEFFIRSARMANANAANLGANLADGASVAAGEVAPEMFAGAAREVFNVGKSFGDFADFGFGQIESLGRIGQNIVGNLAVGAPHSIIALGKAGYSFEGSLAVGACVAGDSFARGSLDLAGRGAALVKNLAGGAAAVGRFAVDCVGRGIQITGGAANQVSTPVYFAGAKTIGIGKASLLAGKEAGLFAVVSAKADIFSFFDRVGNSIRNSILAWLGIEKTNTRLTDNQTSNNQEPNIQKPMASETRKTETATNLFAGQLPPAAKITQIINPEKIKEIQTVRTIINNTNTVVVDESTKSKVEQIMRQLDSDRPGYSLGQSFTMPANLSGVTLNIGGGGFAVDKYGNIVSESVTARGDMIVQGNFTVNGAQTYSGAGSFTASTTAAVLTAIQGGSGLALLADNIAVKGSAVSSQVGDLELGAKSGKIKASAGNVFYTAAGNPIHAAGEEVLRDSVSIFGFDLPARTASASYVAVSRAVALENLSLPEPMAGTTRVYRLSIRYSNASASSTADNFSLGIYDLGAAATISELEIPYSSTGDLDEGAVYLTAPITLPAAGGRWRVEAKTVPGVIIQIYQIDLQAYDRIN